MFDKIKNYYGLNISSYLIILIPVFLISGPFLPDLSLVIIVIFFLFNLYMFTSFKIFKNIFFYFFLFFFICILISLINSKFFQISYKPTISYFRFGLFALASAIIFNLNKDLPFKLAKVFMLIFFILGIDTLVQYSLGVNILGWTVDDGNFRITSLFGEDEVLGSYVARFFPFVLSLFLFSKKFHKWKYENYYLSFIIIISGVISLLSGERTSLFLFIIGLISILLTCGSIRKIFMKSLLILLPILVTFVLVDERVKFRMYDFTVKQLGLSSESKRIVVFSETYEGHYKIAYKMFKEKPLTGHGVKSFRKYCSKKENFIAINACTTHPHNIYMQLLAETGIIPFLIVLSLFLLISWKLIKISIESLILNKKNQNKDYLTLVYIFYAVNLFPIAPSGNFFNNWINIIYYLPSGYFIYLNTLKNVR